MALSKPSNESIWKENIEKLDSKEQRKLLEWQLQAREPICKFSEMKEGDHLVQKSSFLGVTLYYHHFLCTGTDDEGRPTIIHYFNSSSEGSKTFSLTSSFSSGSSSGKVATVQEVTLPHKDFIKSESDLQKKGSEVERVVWPDELKRYSAKEVTGTIFIYCVQTNDTIIHNKTKSKTKSDPKDSAKLT